MRKKIVDYIDRLTAVEEVKTYESLIKWSEDNLKKTKYDTPTLIMNSDGSRAFDDPIVVVAFELGGGVMKTSFYYTESGSFVESAYEMPAECKYTLFHSHNFLEIAYVAEGTLKLSVNGSTVEFAEGDICLMDYNTLHAEVIGEDIVKVLYLSLSPDIFADVMDSEKTPSHEESYLREIVLEKKNAYQYVRFLPTGNTQSSLSAIMSILYEMTHRQPGARDIIKGNITRLCHLLTAEYTLRLTYAEKAQARHRLYSDVIAYIKANSRDIKIEDLSSKFHYNPDFFNRLIKEFSGVTYTDFLQAERINTAEKLLKTTKLPISQIADRVGYQNIGYFYKLFKEKNGVLPTEYRKR